MEKTETPANPEQLLILRKCGDSRVVLEIIDLGNL